MDMVGYAYPMKSVDVLLKISCPVENHHHDARQDILRKLRRAQALIILFILARVRYNQSLDLTLKNQRKSA